MNQAISSSNNNFHSIDKRNLLEESSYCLDVQRNEFMSLKKLKSKLSNVFQKAQKELTACRVNYQSLTQKKKHRDIKRHIRNYCRLEDEINSISNKKKVPIYTYLYYFDINNTKNLTKEGIEDLLFSVKNIDLEDENGQTALQLAIYYRNSEVLKLLIKAGSSLNNASLIDLDFRGARFSRVNFRCSDLRMTDFREANLKGCDFRGAFLSRAKLRGANLHQAIMERSQVINLRNFYLGNIIVWEDFLERYLITRWEREYNIELHKKTFIFIIAFSCYFA